MTDRAEVERDFLLPSLDDLEAEHDAGDLDDDAYRALVDRYTKRAASLLRARPESDRPDGQPVTDQGEEIAGRAKRFMWVAGVVVVAAISGVVLAQSVGSRGSGTSLTGSGGTDRERRAECMSLSFSEPEEAIDCYRGILEVAPEDAEALTYQGWAMVRAGEAERGWRNFELVVSVDPDYPDVRVFRSSVQADRKDWAAAQSELDELYSLDPPAGVLSTLGSMGLDREIAFHLLSPTVQPCWAKAEEAAKGLNGRDASSEDEATAPSRKLLIDAITCLADVSAADPSNLDALQAQGYLLGIVGNDLLFVRARSALDRAIEIDPRSATSLLLRAALLNSRGDAASAKADIEALDALGGSDRPNPLYSVAPLEEIRADIERTLSTTTTTSAP